MPGGDPASLYAEWRALTQAETNAIENESWDQLLRLQQAKADLKARIQLAESPAGPGFGTPSRDCRSMIGELLRMEQHNLNLIAQRREAHEAEQAALQRAKLNLQRFRKGLGHGHGSGWQCYS
jgi:hypothetical protein